MYDQVWRSRALTPRPAIPAANSWSWRRWPNTRTHCPATIRRKRTASPRWSLRATWCSSSSSARSAGPAPSARWEESNCRWSTRPTFPTTTSSAYPASIPTPTSSSTSTCSAFRRWSLASIPPSTWPSGSGIVLAVLLRRPSHPSSRTSVALSICSRRRGLSPPSWSVRNGFPAKWPRARPGACPSTIWIRRQMPAMVLPSITPRLLFHFFKSFDWLTLTIIIHLKQNVTINITEILLRTQRCHLASVRVVGARRKNHYISH